MTEQPRYQQDLRSAAEQDLLSSLWQSEAQCYPWDLTPDLDETYFLALEAAADLDTWEAAPGQSQAFYSHLDQLWLATTTATAATATSIFSRLSARFAGKIPADLLATIVERAQQALHNPMPAGGLATQLRLEQLVYCVQSIVPTWAEADLQVLARPLAYAMRSGDYRSASDRLLETVRPMEWEALSDIEKARLSLTIADYALSTLTMTVAEAPEAQ
ncbi:hypothetical protein OOK60_10340 [Trichothermofontia sichuanensis B231]|uniref:hypothetical protein n=1 Tax=Trichothermofontia sichuanensis TaxID=3045816 RepID=UPI0022454410|nr:hypothetical protein [Trichothermofontia sichuanensis]UZQ52926.1 hypothetical protein OOK60_10340 [Trichothermofontia sichuanensis B231]